MEAGRLSEDMQSTIDDAVRSPVSPVFQNLSGITTARSVLEAMITHGDNTVTDIVLAAVGPAQVRALIVEAELGNTQIPESTRQLTSYIAGAPEGVDLGWIALQDVLKGSSSSKSRAPLNDKQTMASTAEDLVHCIDRRWTGRSSRSLRRSWNSNASRPWAMPSSRWCRPKRSPMARGAASIGTIFTASALPAR
jgi:beta-lactamase class A